MRTTWILLLAIAALAGCMDANDEPDSQDDTSDGTDAPDDGDPFAGDEPVRANHVEVRDTFFRPRVLLVEAGRALSWTNHGEMDHTITPDDPDAWGSEGSGSDRADWLKPDETWLWTPQTPGEYTYHCIPHATETSDGWSGMIGKIIVE